MSNPGLLTRLLVWRIRTISDSNFTLIMAGIIGFIAGIAAVILKSTVHFIQAFLERNIDLTGLNYLYLGFPLIGILLTVIVARYILREHLGHGITQILYSISKNSSILRKTQMYSRMITSALTVGFGGSVGLEAPIVVTGSAIGSNVGRLAHLDYKKRTLLIGCGAAGAISAIFNSPIAGVIFAIEVIMTEVMISKFIPILIASVCGQLVSISLLGEDILFSFKLTDPFKASDAPYYLLLGMFCGMISLYFTRMMYKVEQGIKSIRESFSRALIGGLGLAIIIFTFPPIYGEGYDSIKDLLAGRELDLFERTIFQPWGDNQFVLIFFLLAILMVKPLATALTIGAGGSGGIFAPSLFMGGVAGFFFTQVLNAFIPGLSISASNFALVGMCGVMSGVLHAPLTAIFLIAEITSGYVLFVPLMLVSAISYSTISYFEKHSIYTKKLIEKGDLIQYDRDRIVLSLIDLKKVMETDLMLVKPNATLGEMVELVKKSKRNIFPVVNDQGALEGIVTLDDIREIMFDTEKYQNVVIKAIMQAPPAFVSPQEKMQSVMNKFELTQAWNLPVIEEGKYLGFVSKSRIFNAYRTKLIMHTKE